MLVFDSFLAILYEKMFQAHFVPFPASELKSAISLRSPPIKKNFFLTGNSISRLEILIASQFVIVFFNAQS